MEKKRFENRKAMDPRSDFIAGIHNYCDRWCEKCTMTARCSVFALEHGNTQNQRDAAAEDFWHRLSETFEDTAALLREMAEEFGIDFDEIANAPEPESPDHHIVALQAFKYMDSVSEWFDKWEPRLAELQQKQKGSRQLRLCGDESAAVETSVKNYMEILLWYHTIIPSKLQRAVDNPMEEIEGMEDFPSDADGSAKVALISMDRSITAWTGLLHAMPEAKQEILGFLQQLERLRATTQWTFPRARGFMRPGFDENLPKTE